VFLVRFCGDVASSIARHLAKTAQPAQDFGSYVGLAELHAATVLLPPAQLEHVERTVDPDPAAFVLRTWALAAAAGTTSTIQEKEPSSPCGVKEEENEEGDDEEENDEDNEAAAFAARLRRDPLPALPRLSDDAKRAAGFSLWPLWFDKAVGCSAYEPAFTERAASSPLPPSFANEVRRHLPAMEAFMARIVQGNFDIDGPSGLGGDATPKGRGSPKELPTKPLKSPHFPENLM